MINPGMAFFPGACWSLQIQEGRGVYPPSSTENGEANMLHAFKGIGGCAMG